MMAWHLNTSSDLCSFRRLENLLLRSILLGFVVVAATGLYLRAMPVFNLGGNGYLHFLHGHSHFAFGGWIAPMLVWVMMRFFPELKKFISFKHWRIIIYLLVLSSYGMLAFFPVQGYGPISLVFSTISVIAEIYLAVMVWKALRNYNDLPHLFLKAAMVFLVLSTAGPFATGPIAAMGLKQSPLYYNAVYFYLHFQLNGFFVFTAIAALYRILNVPVKSRQHSKPVIIAATTGVALSVFLSFLWNQPGPIYNIVGFVGALLQLISVVLIVHDLRNARVPDAFGTFLKYFLIAVLMFKSVLQCLSAIPDIANIAFLHRSFTIAYLHLASIGFLSIFAMIALYSQHLYRNSLRPAITIIVGTFLCTEILIVINGVNSLLALNIKHVPELLFWCSIPFAIGATWLLRNLWHRSFEKRSPALNSLAKYSRAF